MKHKFSSQTVNDILRENRESLIDYCRFLAEKYNETLEGKYRIKYNDLYNLLFEPSLSDEKKVELFHSFTNSLDYKPIRKIKKNKIKLV
jgi:hypothetical protein